MRLRLLLRYVCVLAVVYTTRAHGADASPAAPAVQMMVDLSDGSRIIGTPDASRLKMTTDYATLEIPLPLLLTIEFSGEAKDVAQVKLRNGDTLNARLAVKEIALKTLFGRAVIPLAGVRSIQVEVAGKATPDGLVLHYTFDADEGGKVTDASGTGNDGTVQGAVYSSEGRKGGAMSFSGDHQAVTIKNSASLQLQDFSIMAWIKRGDKDNLTKSGVGTDGALFGYGQGGYGMGIKSSDDSLFLSRIGIDNVSWKFGIHDDDWHHVGVTKNGGKVVFYLDGVAYPAPDYDPGFEFTTGVAAGAWGGSLNNSFVGLIHEVEVFNRGLSEVEVKGIYDSQK